MTDEQLEALLVDIESDTVERKSSIKDSEKIREAICAFANDLPGYMRPGVIFVGVRDDGAPAGIPITDQLLQTLASLRSDGNILPFPSLTVSKRTIRGCELAVVVVQPSDAPPVRFRGRTCIRVGPRRAIATAEEERRLGEKRRARDLPFDLRPIPSATVDDLDLDLFHRIYLPAAVDAEVLAANQRNSEEQLRSLRMLNADATPTVLAILALGKDPRQFLPGDYIQFLRVDGKELTDPIRDQKELSGALSDLLTRLDDVLKANISVASDVSESIEIRHPDYPLPALQQLARNAVLHRSYESTNAPVRVMWFSDHIEIQNPGGPFGQVTRENFGTPGVTDYRNPHLAEAMKALGFVQRFGIGIPTARAELEKNGNPPPEFRVEYAHVSVTVRRRI